MGSLDDWLDLIGWVYWIHIVSPTAGGGSAAYWFYVVSWASVSHFLLPSQQRALVSVARGPFKTVIPVCTGYTHLIRTPQSLSLMIHIYTLTDSIVKSYSTNIVIIVVSLYVLLHLCVCIFHVSLLFSLSFLCALAWSHLRPWVCMPRYRLCSYTLRGGRWVLRRFGWAAVGQFVTLLSLFAFSMFS